MWKGEVYIYGTLEVLNNYSVQDLKFSNEKSKYKSKT